MCVGVCACWKRMVAGMRIFSLYFFTLLLVLFSFFLLLSVKINYAIFYFFMCSFNNFGFITHEISTCYRMLLVGRRLFLGFCFNFLAFKCVDFIFWSHKVESDSVGNQRWEMSCMTRWKVCKNFQHGWKSSFRWAWVNISSWNRKETQSFL